MPRKRKLSSNASTPIKKSRGPTRAPSETREVTPRRTEEGLVLTCGQGDTGQLGLGPDVLEKGRLTVISDLKSVVDIKAGGMHTVCLTKDGSVYTFGCDDEGALGRQASDDNACSPGKVTLEKPAVQISAGDSHSAALLEDGNVFAWGCFKDSHGRMGLTTINEPAKTPILIKVNEKVEKIASGADHLLLMTVTGQLYSCGCPEQGQLGRVTARSANRDATRQGMSVFLVPQLVTFRRKRVFIDIWASTYGTFAKEKSQNIFCFGLNNYHQLIDSSGKGDGPIWVPVENDASPDREWLKFAGGDHHTLLLDNNGKVHCLGRKEYGRLGLGENCDDAEKPTLIPALAEEKCVDIACGSAVSFAVTNEGKLYGWGMGSNGQLSTGDDDSDVWTPRLIKAKALENKKVLLVDAGGQHTVVLAV